MPGRLLSKNWDFLPRVPLDVLTYIGVGAGYYASAQLAFLVGTLSDRIFAPFWPPNVILFCGLLLSPRKQWKGIVAVTFCAHVLAELSVGMPFLQMTVAFVTNCVLAIMNAVVVNRFVGGPPWFGTLRKAAVYILAAGAINPAIAAFGGAFVPYAGGEPLDSYWIYWGNWFVGNALAALTFGPIILGWAEADWRALRLTLDPKRAEAGLFVVALLVVSLISFGLSVRIAPSPFVPVILYLPLPVILWGAVRFGAKGAGGAIFVLALASIWLTLNGLSPFLDNTPETSVAALQLFLIALAVPVILLSATIDQLRHSERATRAMAGSILTAQDDERRRIARDLHDSTGQNLIAANLILGGLKENIAESTLASIKKCSDLVVQSIGELRTHAYVLHPPMLDEGGLPMALPPYVEGFAERTGIDVGLLIAPDIGRVPNEVELLIFRVVQEALSNVQRHSGSATARIQLATRKIGHREIVILTIEDRGKGMNLSQGKSPGKYRGVGLESMRERVQQIGGRFTVDSRLGRTVLTAMVPFEVQ